MRSQLFAMTLAACALIGCGSDTAPSDSLPGPTHAVAGSAAPVPAAHGGTSAPVPVAGTAAPTPVTTPPATKPPTTPPTTRPPETPPPGSAPTTPANAPTGTTPPGVDGSKTPEMTPPDGKNGLIRGPEPTAESAAKKGPYQVGEITEGFRDGPDFRAATIHYPMDAEPPFAMIVFCPGWLGTQASDAPWAPFMASHGIIFMNIDTNTTGDSVRQREAAERDALESLQAEHTRKGSPLEGKLALDRVSFMGWSMGGGGAWLNANANPEIKAIITLAGHNATAGGASPLSKIAVPTLMLAGTADTTVLGLGMSQPVYEVIPDTTPKLIYEVEGASHFDFNNPAFMDGIPARYALSWQKVYLEGDMRYYKFLLEKGPDAADFRTNLTP